VGDAGFTPCAYRCVAGLYGHPVYPGVCVRCSEFATAIAPVGQIPLPPAPRGVWDDSAGSCDGNSWACAAGFRRSPAGARYCCPLVVAHSSPAAASASGGSVCGLACDAGFLWNTSAGACLPCAGRPANATWLSTAAAAANQVQDNTSSFPLPRFRFLPSAFPPRCMPVPR
jgi:hypothetical protein